MVKIRLSRIGSKKKPFYRIVAADVRSPRDGKFLEILGHYDPRKKPHELKIDIERVQAWMDNGAKATNRVSKLISQVT
ncbi:MAG: 30S ribosomal protein S16 [Candidatus Dadabacteria bacterium]|nr:30S ribosomal protein S16 [Candidatus Dadabacteria bacterium]MXZ12456.1 30S ribosomal protein S16 [Candidatus Dadabacteria bacterium]MYA47830.1 30S ribosomal protein S16 [Candidatus Dadabacteria bacterium]MYC39484.1 30S ribosomal protein S16 [Candidatus Dadabacteria bacterium]MYF47621.1 30S ribosomal protein S16 [Candidatus Dadabacteria bacterium]